jgi:branched-chain amino acid transport system ATP-binding protein
MDRDSVLKIEDLESGYGPMQVLWKPSLKVNKGTITSLLGPNGVGKSTLLWTVLGAVDPWGGKIIYEDNDITSLPSHKKVDLGLTLVPEGKHLFGGMTVHENLIMGAYSKGKGYAKSRYTERGSATDGHYCQGANDKAKPNNA